MPSKAQVKLGQFLLVRNVSTGNVGLSVKDWGLEKGGFVCSTRKVLFVVGSELSMNLVRKDLSVKANL